MAGQSMRDIKRRIRSVKSTQQITKAMEMVAAAKLRRSQEQVLQGRPFAEKLQEVLARLAGPTGGRASRADHPLLQSREVKRVGYVIVSADRGLAGGYNANILRRAQETIDAEEREYQLTVIGRKARDYFRKRNYELAEEYIGIGDEIDFMLARELARELIQAYEQGELDEVHLVYTRFVSAAVHRPTVERLLPLDRPSAPAETESGDQDGDGSGAEEGAEYLYEPDPATILQILLPRFVEIQVYRALMEAKASELGARMVAMKNASDNADEMLGELTLSFNRARQASITKELSEIVGGADALAGG